MLSFLRFKMAKSEYNKYWKPSGFALTKKKTVYGVKQTSMLPCIPQ